LSRASFGGAPYGLDETGVVKGVFKSGFTVGARMQVADKLSIDLSDIDRGAHEPTGDRSLLGWHELDVRRQLQVPSLEAVGVTHQSG